MSVKRYHEDAFRFFQRKALRDREFQKEILQSARDKSGKDFFHWMEGELREILPDGDIVIGEKELEIPNIPNLTPQQFRQLPDDTASALWGAWKDTHQGLLCSPAVWGYVTTRFIDAEKIKPHYLMVGSIGESTGEAEIDKALKEADAEKRKKAIGGCIRAFLRRLSGIHTRGPRSLYSDCPIATAWWQHHIANEVADDIEKSKKDVLGLLTAPGVWGALSEKMASQLTVIGDKHVRGGLVSFLLEKPEAKGHLDALIKHIGIMSGWRALGMFEPAEIHGIIAKEIYEPLIKGGQQ